MKIIHKKQTNRRSFTGLVLLWPAFHDCLYFLRFCCLFICQKEFQCKTASTKMDWIITKTHGLRICELHRIYSAWWREFVVTSSRHKIYSSSFIDEFTLNFVFLWNFSSHNLFIFEWFSKKCQMTEILGRMRMIDICLVFKDLTRLTLKGVLILVIDALLPRFDMYEQLRETERKRTSYRDERPRQPKIKIFDGSSHMAKYLGRWNDPIITWNKKGRKKYTMRQI